MGVLPDGSKGPSTLEEAVDALAGHALNQVPSAPALRCCGAQRKHSYNYSYRPVGFSQLPVQCVYLLTLLASFESTV